MATAASTELHPMAPHFIPGWMPDPATGDPFMTAMAFFVVALFVSLGILYLRLHALPEQMAHGVGAAQMQIVSVLALLALFTHNNLFWILALLLAGINLPDLLEPLRRIASALENISGQKGAQPPQDVATPMPTTEKEV
ncbi:hypothetical protein [Shimia sagamensis]|uniref:Uncharacterized protein n=1 Tax=Shimia sagamensis TaxID=1566352 RepID=A0ABY1NKV1_9RHOB|nr:hypothetical protein [Shimia sagamensis]SMP11644.1 hypothetical protein SAMN06265373_102286 [Shimia sagamensis]